MSLGVIILAAGQGTRMRSRLPKVLHRVAGRPMLDHVIDTALALDGERISVVYGHGAESVIAHLDGQGVDAVLQESQEGTAHAVKQALPAMQDVDHILVLYGDVPLIRPATLNPLLDALQHAKLAVLTTELDQPTGYGRIVRDGHGQLTKIVEEKDASDAERSLREVNTGILAAEREALERWIDGIGNDNAQSEYYLTDCVALAVHEGSGVAGVRCQDAMEVSGINDRAQLAAVEAYAQRRTAADLMTQGVTLLDPASLRVRGRVRIGVDVEIDANVELAGEVIIGDDVHIGANCVIRDSEIEAGAEILPMCVIEQARVGSGSRVGPFARLRPGAELAGGNHIGNFVEIKNSQIGQGSKVNHLSYVGDTTMGSQVNIGAGTITANYDGANKHRTVIEDNASTGSNSVLVAPVTVGKGATLGAATVLRKTAPEGKLTLTATKQTTVDGWKRPEKKQEK
ncbi:MAG: bifunctional UDP-N-acetylglucosamine diphosphorylase/glucosamine-1-phosphate N-acetyltransferase GlmU [Gammaproteobacteria bacterium]|jgi:bifunctional UDP-N-acetylglucosamine pyrophosphorylase/glucosamine-1-phosphate N-acetyltransferase